jgi:hypothetical protein
MSEFHILTRGVNEKGSGHFGDATDADKDRASQLWG